MNVRSQQLVHLRKKKGEKKTRRKADCEDCSNNLNECLKCVHLIGWSKEQKLGDEDAIYGRIGKLFR